MIEGDRSTCPVPESPRRAEGKCDPSISSPKISLVILAAGESKRFPGNKLLWLHNGEAMVHKITRIALESKVDRVILVTGHQSSLVRGAVADLSSIYRSRLKLFFNPRYRQGMSSSIKAGLGAVSRAAQAAMFLPADIALENPGPINALVDFFSEAKPKIAVVSHGGRRGHPILFRRDFFSEIAAIAEDTQGLKALVKRRRSEVRELEVTEEAVLVDIDSPDDIESHASDTA